MSDVAKIRTVSMSPAHFVGCGITVIIQLLADKRVDVVNAYSNDTTFATRVDEMIPNAVVDQLIAKDEPTEDEFEAKFYALVKSICRLKDAS